MKEICCSFNESVRCIMSILRLHECYSGLIVLILHSSQCKSTRDRPFVDGHELEDGIVREGDGICCCLLFALGVAVDILGLSGSGEDRKSDGRKRGE